MYKYFTDLFVILKLPLNNSISKYPLFLPFTITDEGIKNNFQFTKVSYNMFLLLGYIFL